MGQPASPSAIAEARALRRTYLVALTYPLWHLAAPDGARDPWGPWWLVASSFGLVAGLSLAVPWIERRLAVLLAVCSWLVPVQLYLLASWNDMHPFYVVGSAMAVITTVVFIRERRALVTYVVLLTLGTVTLYQMEPSTLKLAYWGGILTVMPLAYVRLDRQLRREEMAGEVAAELEARVEERTRAVQEANEQLRAEIAERKRLESELRFSHKMEVLGRIAGELAHDFNNLLTTLSIYSELVLDGLDPGSPVRPDAEQIQKTTRQASALTQQLLDFSRGPAEIRSIDLNEAVLDVATMVRGILPPEIELDLRRADRPAPVRADSDQIARVLMNLVLNARDAMPDGGRLTLEVSTRRRDATEAPAGSPAAEYVLVTVADTGVGMDEETLSHAFDPFFTRKPAGEGTGLGLSIVYGIVQQAGGRVRVESEPGDGTRFEIHWPLDQALAEVEEPEPRAIRTRPPAAERILLVEDEERLRVVLARVLRGAGYEVTSAADAAEALREFAQPERAFDLVVSDVVMPGMNGYELAAWLARRHPETKVLLISARPDHPALGGSEAPPGVELLAKPFETRDLAIKVRSVLES